MVNLSSVGETSRGGLSAVASTRRVGVCPKETVEEPASKTITVFVTPVKPYAHIHVLQFMNTIRC